MEGREYLRLYAAVNHQLLYNFYPPAKQSFVNPAFEALIACLHGNPDKAIEVPGEVFCKAQDLIDLFRLDDFVLQEQEMEMLYEG